MAMIIPLAVFIFYLVALFLWQYTGWSTKHEDDDGKV
jgi:nitrogen fixation-related uncharacterized protein